MAYRTSPTVFIPQWDDFSWFNGTVSINGATHKASMVVTLPKAGNIDRIEFATATVTTGCTLEARIETVDASGDPSGSLVAAGATGTVVVANTDDAVWKSVTIGTPPAVTQGQRVALVLAVSAGTPSSLLLRISSGVGSDSSVYNDLYSGATWAKGGAPMAMTVRYQGDAESVHIPGLLSARLPTNISVNTGTTPDEAGNKIVVPYTMKFKGWWLWFQTITGDGDLILYDDADNVLATVSSLAAQRRTTGISIFGSTADVVLLRGQTVRVVYLPTTVTSTALLQQTDAKIYGFSMQTNCASTIRTNAGAWTDGTEPFAIGMISESILTPDPFAYGIG